MLAFFRKIRKSLLIQGKTSKYLSYAIGEIVLVMIGILLALQVNNWNELKKIKVFEIKMLKEIKNAIVTDIDYITNHSLGYRTKTVENSVVFFKKLLRNEKAPMDSLRYYFNWTTYGLSFQINEGPYQGLKSVGMDKISNDSLRNSLQYLYDFTIPRTEELVEWSENRIEKNQSPLKKQFLKAHQYKLTDADVKIYSSLVDGDFWKHPSFLELLYRVNSRASWNRTAFTTLVKKLTVVKNSIDKELHSLENN